jgi:hypothetical protein
LLTFFKSERAKEDAHSLLSWKTFGLDVALVTAIFLPALQPE